MSKAAIRPLLVALGDSWFAYWPRGDVIDCLSEHHGYDAISLAKAGWSLAEVLRGTAEEAPVLGRGGVVLRPPSPPAQPQIEALAQRLAAMLPADKLRLRALLVSAGGNDVAGRDAVLRRLIAPYAGTPALLDGGVQSIVHGTMRADYEQLLRRITALCEEHLGRRAPVVLHGYDHPVPDGRGALAARWLKPTLDALGYPPDAARTVMAELIDALNTMQADLIATLRQDGFTHLHALSLVGTLRNDGTYREDWQNELHPSIPRGFARVAEAFAHKLNRVSRAGDVAAKAVPEACARVRRASA
jgi:hypothetical protein